MDHANITLIQFDHGKLVHDRQIIILSFSYLQNALREPDSFAACSGLKFRNN